MLLMKVTRTNAEVAYVNALNSTASVMSAGYLVSYHTRTAASATGIDVEQPVTSSLPAFCGVVYANGGSIAVGAYGLVQVYGYGTAGMAIPEGYLNVQVPNEDDVIEIEILYPTNPGSIYHMTKVLDQTLFAYYAKNDELRITDLHQGIIWGTNTRETNLDERLINRFDYDGDYGTVLNRFLMQAAVGYPLTVHGTGGQTRAFIHLQDMVRCIEIALDNPPNSGDRVMIFNQMTETHRVRDLANLVAELTGASVEMVPDPRKEALENDLVVRNDQFLALGLNPITLSEGLLREINETAGRYADRADCSRIPATSLWTKNQQAGIPSSVTGSN